MQGGKKTGWRLEERQTWTKQCKYKKGNKDIGISENPEMGVHGERRRLRTQGPR